MNEEQKTYQLAAPPEYWDISLRDGSQIIVLAHAYSVDGDKVLFSLLCRGTPNFEIESLRIPLALMPEDFSTPAGDSGPMVR